GGESQWGEEEYREDVWRSGGVAGGRKQRKREKREERGKGKRQGGEATREGPDCADVSEEVVV
ncbi:hypothetical protein, partial [Acinetobacter baumannii]|uniref:hypothetical protein n=1 Tax=Acinetobacter baumannii TaxID=470 RepID=UPI002F3ED574